MLSLSEFISDQINEIKSLKEQFICMNCSESLENPVRLKVCDHYFCEDCFDENEKSCPKCKTFFDMKDVDRDSVIDEGIQMIKNLEGLVNGMYSRDDTTVTENTSDTVLTVKKILNSRNTVKIFNNKEPLTRAISLESTDNVIHYNTVKCFIIFTDLATIKRNAKGETPLHVGCRKSNLNSVKELIEKGIDLNAKDFAGWSPLHEAIESVSIDIVKLLIKHGAQINIPGPSYTTPLHKAVSLENEELIQILVESGANLNALDYHGRMPINNSPNTDIHNLLKRNGTVPNREEKAFVPKKIIAYCHSIDDEYLEKLKKIKQFVTVKKEFDIQKAQLTHLIVKDTHKLSFKVLLSLLKGLIIVPQQWIDLILEKKFYLPLSSKWKIMKEEYLNISLKEGLINHLLNKPKLFDGLNFFIERHNKTIYIHNLSITKNFLKLMITSGGGNVLHRAPAPRTVEGELTYPFHAKDSDIANCSHYIIYEENTPPLLRYDMKELKHRSSRWLIDCARYFKILATCMDC